jgi:hypothetical protein
MAVPIHHWKLDELSGTTIVDSIGSLNATAINGGTPGESGKIGTSWELQNQTIINDCSSTSTFVNVQSASFSTNITTYKTSPAMNVYRSSPSGVDNLGFEATFTEQDLTNKFIKFYLYIKDATTLAKFNAFKFYIHGRLDLHGGIDGWNVYEWGGSGTLQQPVVGWNVYTLDASNPTGTESDGADLTTSDKVRFRLYHSLDTAAIFAVGDVIIDTMVSSTTKNLVNFLTGTTADTYLPNGSISLWVYPYGTPVYSSNNQSGKFRLGGDRPLIYGTNSFGLAWSGASTQYPGGVEYSDNVWSHLVLTWENAGTGQANGIIKWYKNGVLGKTTTDIQIPLSSTGTIQMGAYSGNSPLWGKMDDVRLYNVILTQAEVTQLYNQGVIKIRADGAWKDVDNIKINIGDTWKDVESIKQNVGGVWKTVF